MRSVISLLERLWVCEGVVKVPEAFPRNVKVGFAFRKYREAVGVFGEKVFSCGMMDKRYSCVGSPEKSQ